MSASPTTVSINRAEPRGDAAHTRAVSTNADVGHDNVGGNLVGPAAESAGTSTGAAAGLVGSCAVVDRVAVSSAQRAVREKAVARGRGASRAHAACARGTAGAGGGTGATGATGAGVCIAAATARPVGVS